MIGVEVAARSAFGAPAVLTMTMSSPKTSEKSAARVLTGDTAPIGAETNWLSCFTRDWVA